MKIMNLRSIFLVSAAILGIWVPTPRLYAPPASPAGIPQQLSEEDVKFLEELGKQIQKEVEQLPTRKQLEAQGMTPAEIERGEKEGRIQTKDKFDEDVQRYSAMSEEQLWEEMQKAIAEVEKASAAEGRPEYPSAPVYQGEQEAPTPAPAPAVAKPTPAQTSKQQTALATIDALLKHISNFLRKAQAIAELPVKISSWIKEGKLRNWPMNATWGTFKTQLEELEAKLNKIKDKDPKSGTYKYIEELIKDENSLNGLVRIKDALARSEPKIELGSFGIDKMSGTSRQAIRDVLVSLQDALSANILISLDKVIEKYEPTAKKIKESEEAAQRKALEQSRMGRSPSYTSVGGYPKADDYRGARGDYDRGFDRYTPGYFDAPEREKARSDEKKDAKGATPAGGAGGKADGKKPEDKKPESAKPKREEDKTAQNFVNKFNDGLYAFQDALQESKNLKNIEKHMNDASEVDFSMIEQAKSALEGVRDAQRAAQRLKSQLSKLTAEQKKEYKKDIRDSYKPVSKEIDAMLKQLEALEKSMGAAALLPGQPAVSQQRKMKNFAYLGKKNEAALRESLNTLNTQVSAGKKEAEDNGTNIPADIFEKEIEAKKIEALLNNQNLANLNDLKEKLKELKKLASEF